MIFEDEFVLNRDTFSSRKKTFTQMFKEYWYTYVD